MRCLLALITFTLLLEVGLCRPKKATKVEKGKDKGKHKTADKKGAAVEPEKTQKGTKKQMLGGLPGGDEQPMEALGGGQFGGGGLGGEMEGMPTGMGAGAEPLGFGPMGASPMGALAGAIPGIANPQAEDSRFEDGPRGTPIGLMGIGGPNGEEQMEGGPDQAPIVAGGLHNGESPFEGALEQSRFGRLGPPVDVADKLNVEGPSLASFAPGIGSDYNGDDSNPLNSLPSGNMISPVINGPVEGMPAQQAMTGMVNGEIQDSQLVNGVEQQEGPQDLGQEAANIAKMSENSDVGAAIKEIDRVPDAKDVMHQEPEGHPINMENAGVNTVQSLASAESAELRQTATDYSSYRKTSLSSQASKKKPVSMTNSHKHAQKDMSPANIRDVEATSMTGGQVMMGVQGGMKRHNLKKTKATKKSTKGSKKKSS